jgi:hypothetical protein
VRTCFPRVGLFFLFLSLLAASGFAQQVSPQPLINQPLITQPIDESQLTTLKGNTHLLAQPQFDIGIAQPDMPLNRMLLVLKRSPQQDFALRKMLDDQQDKASPNYHKWVTPDEFGVQFGPSDQDLQLVTGWLQSHGFQVNRVAHGRSVIEFSGVESQVEAAFHTQIHRYMLANGEQHWANASDPQIPAALSPAVAGVWSLHDFRKLPNVQVSPQVLKTKYTPGKQPDTTFPSSSGVIHALSPADYAVIYNLNPLYASGISGAGNIAVVARSNLFADGFPFSSNVGSDVANFQAVFNVPTNGLRIINDGPDPGDLGGGEEVEVTLDASWSEAVAPGATVNVVVSASTATSDGVDLSELYIIDNNVAPVMTESFGSCELSASQTEAQGISMLSEQAAAQGITYLVSSGDAGVAGCDNPNTAPATQGASVNILSSPQFTVAVGGTMFNEGSNSAKYWSSANGAGFVSALSYIPEDVWNESCLSCQFPDLFSSAGGHSTFFSKPTWQSGVSGIPSDGFRDVPDVSLTAAIHDGYLLCLEASCVPDSQGFISFALIGGTSASTPSFAGIMSLVDQQQQSPQGEANYVLYRLAAAETLSQCNASIATPVPASTCIFNDVTVGNNSVPGVTGFSAGVGYDLATGLGSVNATNLVHQWNTVVFRATTATLTPSSIVATHGSPVSLGISVAPNSGTGTPTGDVSLQTSLIAAPGFIDDFPPVQAGFLILNGGSTSSTVKDLPGGSYTLTTQYAGDANFAPSPPSSPINVTISPENSSTALAVDTVDQSGNLIPFTGGQFGSFVYLRADVFAPSGHGTPTGSVAFSDNSSPLGALNLNSAGNTVTPNGYFGFNIGQHSVVAQYRGDNSFNVSNSPPAASFTISQASTSTALAPVSGGIQGSNITLTANLTSAAFAGAPFNFCATLPCETQSDYPSGTVTFFAGGTQLGTAQVSGTGVTPGGVTAAATFSTAALPAGSNTITAQYSGDVNYLASTAAPITVAVSADFTFAAGGPSITVAKPGGNGTLVLNITGQNGYSGTVNFSPASCSGLPFGASCSFGPVSVTGTGSTTITASTLAPVVGSLRRFGWTTAGLVFAGVFLLGVPRKRFRTAACLSIVLLAFAAAGTGCGGGGGGGGGGGNNSPGTPQGSYLITVTATSGTGATAITHTTTFTLVVN